ncbi:unnamed protein product, partial [Linum tenue]
MIALDGSSCLANTNDVFRPRCYHNKPCMMNKSGTSRNPGR